MRLSDGMLAIAAGSHHRPIDISGSDEVAEPAKLPTKEMVSGRWPAQI
jgi:hypothetical protein